MSRSLFSAAILLWLAAAVSLDSRVLLSDPLFRPGASVDYLIISAGEPSMRAQAERLAEIKRQKGLKTLVWSADSLLQAWPGKNDAERIRHAIQTAWKDSGATWVLLFGDYIRVPGLYAYCHTPGYVSSSDTANLALTDLYYSCLEGEWDPDNDSLFGAEDIATSARIICRYDSAGSYSCDSVSVSRTNWFDLEPDVYLGRFPVTDSTESRIMVDKLIQYGYWPQNNPYAEALAFSGANIGTGTFSLLDDQTIAENTYYWYYTIRPIYNSSPSPIGPFENIYLFEDIVFPNGHVGNASIPRTKADYLDLLSQGCGLFYYFGHGGPNSWAISSIMPTSYLYAWDLFGIRGKGLSNIVTLSCHTASFDKGDCMGHRLLVEPAGGAISYIGGTVDIYTMDVKVFHNALARQIASNSVFRIGKAFQLAKMESLDSTDRISNYPGWWRENYLGLLFWGDPEMEMWTRNTTEADTFRIAVSGAGDSTWQVSIEPALDSILVCLYKPGEVFARDFTIAGTAYFRSMQPGLHNVMLTATRHDYVPTSIYVDGDLIPVEQSVATSSLSVTVSPNPFNPSATLRFPNPDRNATIAVYDLRGRIVRRWNHVQEQELIFNGNGLAPGLYIARVSFTKQVRLVGMILEK